MLKPLELTIYPLDQSFPAGYRLPRDTRITHRSANRMAEEKRLTDVDIAAEWWKSLATVPALYKMHQPAAAERETQIAKTLEKFATLPHYDEEVTP